MSVTPSASARCRSMQLDEAAEEVARVVRPGRRLGMILHRERRAAPSPRAPRRCDRSGSRASPRRGRRSESMSTTKPWFCDVISTLPVARSCTGWLPPWCPNLSFDGLAAEREAEDLVPEADAEDRHLAERARATFSGAPATASGSPGPLDRKTPSGSSASTSRGRRRRRHHAAPRSPRRRGCAGCST